MSVADAMPPEVAPPSAVCDSLFEIVDDLRVELPPMAAYGTRIASLLNSKIEQFAAASGLGRAVTEMLFRISSAPNIQRRPDVAFVSFDRWPKAKRIPPGNAWDVVPELVVEVVSPTNLAEEIPTRVREFFGAGARRIWVIYPHESLAYEYDSPRTIRILGPEDTLEGGPILPGFRLALADLFEGTGDAPTA